MPDQDDDEQIARALQPGLEDNGIGVPLSDSGDRPTIGMRMAGLGPKPAPAPVDTTPPPAPQINIDPSKMPPGLMPPASTPQNIPTPPTGSNNPNLTELAKQQAQFGKPLDRSAVDPNTGKPMYKQGVGTKVLGTVANFLQGFGRRPFTPVDVSSGATNARYARDEATREGNLANVNTQIGTQESLDKENQKGYEDALKAAYEGQLGEKATALGRAAEENAGTRKTLADTTTELNDTKEELNRYKAGNAPPTNEFSGWYSAFKKDNGRNPTAKEIQQYELQKARAGKDTSAADLQKAIQISEYKGKQAELIDKQKETERTRRYAELEKDLDRSFVVGTNRLQKSQDGKAKIDQDLETKYAPKIQQMSDEADKMLGLTKSGKALQSQPAKPNAPKIDPKNLPKTVMVNGKPRTVVGYNDKTKKVQVAPEGQ